jgi:hypothetical protein
MYNICSSRFKRVKLSNSNIKYTRIFCHDGDSGHNRKIHYTYTINITRADARVYQKPQVVVFTDFIIYCLLVNP